jgi:DnaJ-class molecular chaperone
MHYFVIFLIKIRIRIITNTYTIMAKLRLEHPALKYCEEHDGSDFILVDGKMVVCPTCQGTGSHVRHDLDDSAMVDSMREDCDYEGLEAYFGGAFDERCTHCGGENVILVPDADSVPDWAQKAIESWEESRRMDEAITAAERRMGA